MAGSKAGGTIQPIDRTAVHRICSGQVVLDLATAVKELVENSLDAGATSIDVRLKNHGAELIEVADNGTGVSWDNYQALTLKYHTSKISKFSDLNSLCSFGFRGEALSSLCALARVSIVTRTQAEAVAVRLEYDHSGIITFQENVARAVGTTVSIVKLFSPLPVRFKEFRRENNIRREYGRLLSVLQAYALIAKGVRLICSNQNGRAGRNVVVQTQGKTSMKDSIVTVFGTKTAACMEQLNLTVSDSCSIEGFISKPGAGYGRPSGDRQFFYVNGRPVDMPKVAKLLNELYRSFNSVQYPMLILNFILPPTAYDVNVTPDKRKLFLHSESDLMASLKESLEKLYAPSKYTYALNDGNLEKEPLSGRLPSSTKPAGKFTNKADFPFQADDPSDTESEKDQRENIEAAQAPVSPEAAEAQKNVSGKGPLHLLSFQHKITMGPPDRGVRGAHETGLNFVVAAGRNLPAAKSPKKIQSRLTACVLQSKKKTDDSLLSEQPVLKRWKQSSEIHRIDLEHVTEAIHNRDAKEYETHDATEEQLEVRNGDEREGTSSEETQSCDSHEGNQGELADGCPGWSPNEGENLPSVNAKVATDFAPAHPTVQPDRTKPENGLRRPLVPLGNAGKVACEQKVDERENSVESLEERPVIQFDVEKLRKKFDLGLLRGQMTNTAGRKQKVPPKSCFAAATLSGIAKEGVDKEAVLAAATKELERSFDKSDFKRMKVLGQFNLGFILAKMEEDIFIIDQHASDEKYNFERLSKTTVLNRQPLLRPLVMELSAAEEMTVISHIETFRMNGFDFIDDNKALAGRRLQLSAVPFSQNVTFGVGDAQELISLLADAPLMSFGRAVHQGGNQSSQSHRGQLPSWLPRPKRVRAMLASRACRSSVMIGDSLSKQEMERILSHLAELDSPWNCPHGRPTMRHLVDLNTITRKFC